MKTVNGESQNVVELNIEEENFYMFGERSRYEGIMNQWFKSNLSQLQIKWRTTFSFIQAL